VQGQLRSEYVSVEVVSTCKHCNQVIQFKIDSTMKVSIPEGEATPLMFSPDVDWNTFAGRTIIDAF
jgi:hypothetical protein